jgi:hypothetical protein
MNMKKWYLLAMLISVSSVYANNSTTGAIGVTIGLGTGHLTSTNQIFYSNILSYTPGGVTFTYPSGLFTQKPFIRVTLALTGRPYRTYEIAMHEIVSTSSAQTKVRVNIGSTVGFPPIFEASSGDVEVYLEAWQLDDTLP